MRERDRRPAWPALRGAACAAAIALAGCAVQPPSGSDAASTSPPLQLIAAGELELPDACAPRPGAVYRVSYVVQRDGRVAQAESGPGADCVDDALRTWVGTFEYRAPGATVATVLDWMDVTAARLR